MTIVATDQTVITVIDYLKDAPTDLSDTLTRIYADWCRRQPSTFHTSSPTKVAPPILPNEISRYAKGFEKLLRDLGKNFEFAFPVLLTSDHGIDLLWSLHEAGAEGSQRALYSYLPVLSPLEHIRRGGINIYKRFSWTMHVMIVSRVLWSDLPQGNLPPTIAWPDSTRSAMALIQSEYSRLDANEIRLLRLASVIHDIGVKDGVEGHDKKGIPYVESAVSQLGGSTRISELISGILSPAETVTALQALVGEHTLASKVNGEEGPAHIRDDVERWLALSASGSRLRRFLEDSFPRLLATFLVCDIIGVADELLTAPTINRATKSIAALSGIISSREIGLLSLESSAERIGVLIGIESSEEVMTIVRELFSSEKEISEFLLSIGSAELLDYAMGILKPIGAPKAAIAIMASLVQVWQNLALSHRSRPLELRFSPHCDLDSMRRWGEAALASMRVQSQGGGSPVMSDEFGVVVEMVGEPGARQLHVRTQAEQA